MPSSEFRGIDARFRPHFQKLYSDDEAERLSAAQNIRADLRILAGRGEAVTGSGFVGMQQHLSARLGSTDAMVRSCVAESLGWIRANSVEDLLRGRLHRERDPSVKVALHFALSQLGDLASRGSVSAWVTHHDAATRRSAMEYAPLLGEVKALSGLERYAAPGNALEDRLSAIHAIGSLGALCAAGERERLSRLLTGYARGRDEILSRAALSAAARIRRADRQ